MHARPSPVIFFLLIMLIAVKHKVCVLEKASFLQWWL